ncbi:MAG: helix-turn-helix transcriptional regulator [Myxococcota bacterium]
MPRRSEINLVDAAYDLEVNDSTWLASLARAFAQAFPTDRGLVAARWQAQPDGRVDGTPHFVDAPDGYERFFEENRQAVEDNGIMGLALQSPCATLRESFLPGHPFLEATLNLAAPYGISDMLKLSAHDTPMHMITLSPLHSKTLDLNEATRARYEQIGHHLSAALRLRAHVESGVELTSEAVFDPNGVAQHAEGQAIDLLTDLRSAVVERERARSSLGTRDPDHALDLWKGMVDGRWSLVDRFESDGEGRRFILAIPNQLEARDPRALSPKEEQVAQLVGSGRSNKEIAHNLGLSEHTVASHVSSALTKLRCEGRGDLIRWMQAENMEFTTNINGLEIGVLVEPEHLPEAPDAGLSPAEHDVLIQIRKGMSNQAIAAARGTSRRTVANQVASILRKTGARSRYELMSGP